MAYSAEISRVNPTCFLFLVDQSGRWRNSGAAKRARPRPKEWPMPLTACSQTLVTPLC